LARAFETVTPRRVGALLDAGRHGSRATLVRNWAWRSSDTPTCAGCSSYRSEFSWLDVARLLRGPPRRRRRRKL